jgi:cytochrome c5
MRNAALAGAPAPFVESRAKRPEPASGVPAPSACIYAVALPSYAASIPDGEKALSKADDIFYREFAVIILLLFLFTVCMIFLARFIGSNAFENMQNSDRAIVQRIEPMGQVRVGDPNKTTEAPAAAAPQVAAAQPQAPATQPEAAAKAGDKVYNSACVACHAAGVAGAPKLGDKAAWEPRLAQGMDGLVSSVVKGKNAMPPKAGNPSLSEEDIRSAVKYMLEQVGVSG